MKEVYLDNAAATAISSEVTRAMNRAAREAGNPSSFNDAGRRARAVLDDARVRVAAFLNARPDEVVFCASGSEANSLAIRGVIDAAKSGVHAAASAIEHPSVLETLQRLKRVSLVRPDAEGIVSVEAVMGAIKSNTVLVSVMYANNEVGSVQPIKQLARAIRELRKKHRSPYPYLHVDACQATAWLPMDVQALGADFVVLNGAKVHGPRGIAALYIRRGVRLNPQILGGQQELGRRAGTENVPATAGLARALELVKPLDAERVGKLWDNFMARLPKILPDARYNGPAPADSLPNIINISIPGASSEELLLGLDRAGIRAGAGSACTAHRVEPSHVLVAMGVPRAYLGGALRFSLSRSTTKADLERLAVVLPKVVASVRSRRIWAKS